MVEFWGRFSRLATYLRISRAGVPRLSTSAVALAFGNECSRSHHGSQGPRSRQPPKRPRVSTHRTHPLHCGRSALCRKRSLAWTKVAGRLGRLRASGASCRTPTPLRTEAGGSGFFEDRNDLSEQTLVVTKSSGTHVRGYFVRRSVSVRLDPREAAFAVSAQNRVIFAAGGFGYFATLALYSSTAFNSGPATHSYISPMLRSSRGSASMLKTLG